MDRYQDKITYNGGSATVTQGTFNEQPVAVKRHNDANIQYINERDTLHLLTKLFSDENTFPQLIDQLEDGNHYTLLETWLPFGFEDILESFGEDKDFSCRLKILYDIAKALDLIAELENFGERRLLLDIDVPNLRGGSDGIVRICDLGFCIPANSQRVIGSSFGIPNYFPPELKAKPLDTIEIARAHIYQLAMFAYPLLYGPGKVPLSLNIENTLNSLVWRLIDLPSQMAVLNERDVTAKAIRTRMGTECALRLDLTDDMLGNLIKDLELSESPILTILQASMQNPALRPYETCSELVQALEMSIAAIRAR